jgi:hypothetical protein
MERAQMDIVVGPNGMGRIGMEPSASTSINHARIKHESWPSVVHRTGALEYGVGEWSTILTGERLDHCSTTSKRTAGCWPLRACILLGITIDADRHFIRVLLLNCSKLINIVVCISLM